MRKPLDWDRIVQDNQVVADEIQKELDVIKGTKIDFTLFCTHYPPTVRLRVDVAGTSDLQRLSDLVAITLAKVIETYGLRISFHESQLISPGFNRTYEYIFKVNYSKYELRDNDEEKDHPTNSHQG